MIDGALERSYNIIEGVNDTAEMDIVRTNFEEAPGFGFALVGISLLAFISIRKRK